MARRGREPTTFQVLPGRAPTARHNPSQNLVELMGFEPTTFPVLPGRAYKCLDEFPILLAFDIELPSDRPTSGSVLLRVDQLPGATIPQREGVVRIVVGKTLLKVFR